MRRLSGTPWPWVAGRSLWPILFLLGCGDRSAQREVLRDVEGVPVEFSHDGLPLIPLRGEVLLEGDPLGLPITLARAGGQAIIGDAVLDPAVHILDLEGESALRAFGARGEGPGEFTSSPRLIQLGEGFLEPGLWAVDPAQARMTLIPLDQMGGDPSETAPTVTPLGLEYPIVDLKPFGSGFVAWGFFPGSRLALLDGEGNWTSGLGPIPAPAALDRLHEPLRHRAYQAWIASEGSRVVAASWRSSRIDVFELAPSERHGWSYGPHPFSPDVHIPESERTNRVVFGSRNRAGHVGVAVSSEFILTLFSGRLQFGFRRDMDEAEFLHVYDWSPAFVRAFKLDRPVRAFSCEDPSCRAVLALSWTPVPAIVRYRIPQ